MSEQEIQRRMDWQDEVYSRLAANAGLSSVRVLGKDFAAYEGVFAPHWADSELLARVASEEVRPSDLALDMGTGTGIQAVFMGEVAHHVIAADINPLAVECAGYNALVYGLEEKITVVESDLFSNIQGTFDLITYNPPFRWFKPRDMLERGELDEDYESLTSFFGSVGEFMKLDGRLLLVFSDSGDLKYLHHLMEKARLDPEIAEKEIRDSWEYVVYRLTKK